MRSVTAFQKGVAPEAHTYGDFHSLGHNFLKAVISQKSGTWALNDTETQSLEEKLALQNY